jgi:regulator of RNase E activity RraB
MITRDSVEWIFANSRARAKWNIDDVCLWGYFFTDHDRDKLSAAALVLERMGYRVVGFLEATPDDEDPGLLFLHVEKEELHTVETLDARNHELHQFAEEFGLESYDGMDVGPIDDPL